MFIPLPINHVNIVNTVNFRRREFSHNLKYFTPEIELRSFTIFRPFSRRKPLESVGRRVVTVRDSLKRGSRSRVTRLNKVYVDHGTMVFHRNGKLARISEAVPRCAVNFVRAATLFISCRGCTLCACTVAVPRKFDK